MRIAIIGTGISGLTCAHLLSKKHHIDVFEASSYIGGHTHTVAVSVTSDDYYIDTGFIVFNDWTYPHFIKLMDRIGVKSKESSMSFSVKVEESGIEYNGTSINSLFSQRLNFFRPSFHRMIQDILRFNQECLSVLDSGTTQTLGAYLQEKGYSKEFKDHYVVPMGAAIWSSSVDQMDQFPIEYFVRFFKNHGMLSVNDRPVWRVIEGGSSSYIPNLIDGFESQIHLRSPVLSVVREANQIKLSFERNGELNEARYDHVIFASHSDQSLKILKDASPLETEILSKFEYQPNSTVLHTDESVLPEKKRAWAAWNYFVPREKNGHVAVTYDMNILQGIKAPETFCVSLNMDERIDPKKVLKKFIYHHPVYTQAAFQAQKRWAEISGVDRTHFCGAYWGYGFHEDGVKSALQVCEKFSEAL